MIQNIDNKQDISKHLLDKLRVGAVIIRFFSDDEPKEKFNCKCEKCDKTRTVVFRVGNWGKKSYKCYPCLLKEGVQNDL